MQHQRQGQHRLIAIGGDQLDAAQVFVVLVRLDLAGDPAQDEVDGRHQLDLDGIGVQGVLARGQGAAPDTTPPGLHLFAVAERLAGHVLALAAVVGDDDPHVADGDQRLGLQFHGGKPAVDVERAIGQHLQLLAAQAPQGQERLRVLEVLVAAGAIRRLHLGGDDLAGRNGRAIVDGDDAEGVRRRERRIHLAVAGVVDTGVLADDDRVETMHRGQLCLPVAVGVHGLVLQRPGVDTLFGDHHEQRQVEGEHALAEDGALPATLTAGRQEGTGILEVVAGADGAEGLGRRQRTAVTGVDIADLALGHHHQRMLVDAVLPGEVPRVHAPAQHVGLEPGLPVAGHDLALRQGALRRP